MATRLELNLKPQIFTAVGQKLANGKSLISRQIAVYKLFCKGGLIEDIDC